MGRNYWEAEPDLPATPRKAGRNYWEANPVPAAPAVEIGPCVPHAFGLSGYIGSGQIAVGGTAWVASGTLCSNHIHSTGTPPLHIASGQIAVFHVLSGAFGSSFLLPAGHALTPPPVSVLSGQIYNWYIASGTVSAPYYPKQGSP